MSTNCSRKLSSTVPSLLMFAFLAAGCAPSAGGPAATGPLSAPAPDQVQLSAVEPRQPYTELAPGVLARTRFVGAGEKGYRIEVHDLMVGPGQRGQHVVLPGTALLEVRSGTGNIVTDDNRSQALEPGATVTLANRQPFIIENKSDSAVIIRAYVFAPQ